MPASWCSAPATQYIAVKSFQLLSIQSLRSCCNRRRYNVLRGEAIHDRIEPGLLVNCSRISILSHDLTPATKVLPHQAVSALVPAPAAAVALYDMQPNYLQQSSNTTALSSQGCRSGMGCLLFCFSLCEWLLEINSHHYSNQPSCINCSLQL